ncbi:PD-(D/E)XK nuclease family protein [Priestia megaterium]|jgi:hypothetical protein|uniref:PD-(D/E)XK nuclease family protein n=1 Tax=Priestia megaterium TaxID=1404 RepID=UPI00211D9E42|nr:PD-(D/E)XK nuclease family protein [Priestia megaterium]MDF2011713.1 PD-(D/E)XK nuclease family protein [Priestia megaterium]MED3872264.1 PD-(D/E)XK nuclease family protein [Priestia megaterium]MED4064553.1 PD-(D/E)XK nuclease family protein [Priestia megaterium]
MYEYTNRPTYTQFLKKDVNSLFQITDFPEFSWSYSRHKMVTQCNRKYAYHYYVSHNGWLDSASAQSQSAYRLKKVSTLSMYAGQAVRQVITEAISDYTSTKLVPNERNLAEKVQQLLNNALRDSTDYGELWYHKPAQYKMLLEFYENGYISKKDLKDMQKRVHICVHHFLQSKSFCDIVSSPFLEVEPHQSFRSINVYDHKVYAPFHSLFKNPVTDEFTIVDWKISKQTKDDLFQLAIYALYVLAEYNISVDQIKVRNEYLLSGSARTYQLTLHEIEAVLQQVDTSIDYMKTFLEDSEVNQPLPLEHFPQTDTPASCHGCAFKELCQTG